MTSLCSYAMPLLRYRIGDYGIPSEDECPCGRSLPLLKQIEGRTDDFIRLADGRLVSPRRASTTVWETLNADQYRIIQKKMDLVFVEVKKTEKLSEVALDRVSKRLEAVLGPDMDVQVKVVEHITLDKSGKIRRVISEVKQTD